MPEGADAVSRFVKLLESQDERFAYFFRKRPRGLSRDLTTTGKSGKQLHFDLSFSCSSYPWDRMHEGVRVLLRVKQKIGVDDVREMKEDFQDLLKRPILKSHGRLLFVFRSTIWRVVLLQTKSSEISEDAIMYANENHVKYERMVGGNTYDWSSPIELLAETPDGSYEQGIFYFG